LDDTLKTLIAYYEKEKRHLRQFIDGYTKEWEYEFAHFHAQALFQVNRKLQTLYSLQDRRYDEKSTKQNSIRFLEERLQAESSDYLHEGLTKMLEQKKKELNKLNELSEPVNDPPNGGALNEALNNILERRIEGFALLLSQDDNLLFDFSYKARTLKVVLPYMKRHLKTEMLSDENILVLQDMGFKYNSNKSRLILLLNGEKAVIVHEIRWRLAKIVFELFYFPSFEGKSSLSIRDKASR
jgi:hypothetical protein